MPTTLLRGGIQINDGTVVRNDLDVATPGSALIRRIIAGPGIYLNSTGADTGTGDVTINVNPFHNNPEYAWDCNGLGSAANTNNWQSTVISTGTVTAVTTSIASGTPVSTQAVDLANHPGVLSLGSSTTANSGVQITWGAPTSGFPIKGGEQYDFIVFIVNLTNLTMRFGQHDAGTFADAVDGVYFEIPSSGIPVGKNASNSVRSTTPSLTTLNSNTWYHFRITVDAIGSQANFRIYDMAGGLLANANLAGNIPTGVGRDSLPRLTSTNSGTVATLMCQVDYLGFKKTLSRGALT